MFFVLLVAISLSIDALGIGLSYGVRNIVTPFFTKCILFLETMFFMGLFLWIGNHMTFFFSAKTANNIGIVLLFLMGLFLCYQSFHHSSTELLQNPCSCDKDHSSHIDAKEGLCLGFLLSLDSMGAGIGAGAANISLLLPLFTSIFQILFLSIGISYGKHLKTHFSMKDNLWTAFSGGILILIAFIRYFY